MQNCLCEGAGEIGDVWGHGLQEINVGVQLGSRVLGHAVLGAK